MDKNETANSFLKSPKLLSTFAEEELACEPIGDHTIK